jgi:uncharacterized protein YacL
MPSRRPRSTGIVPELLRLLVVVIGGQIGYAVAHAVNAQAGVPVLGALDGLWLGAVLGGFVGYVLGGVLSRSTLAAVDRASDALRGRSAEEVLAGAVGAGLGGIVGAAIAWPLLIVGSPGVGVPLFGFIVLAAGLLGHRLGLERGTGIVGLIGPRAGMAPRRASAAALPRIVDSSVAIDGRVLDVVRAGFLHGRMLVPSVVLAELQGLADAGDDLRRSRGRRGLEVLETLKGESGIEFVVIDDEVPDVPEVDSKLIRLCQNYDAALLTLDTNLARAAHLTGLQVLNLHALTLALRPPVVAGDDVSVLLLKPGKEQGQAIGYLDDGTMVVVESARDQIGREEHVRVTSVLTTANGRMVFGRPVHLHAGDSSRSMR